MKNSSRISIMLIFVMLMGGLYLNNQTNNPATALGTIEASVEAGDTYWYNVTDFPTFAEILDLSGVAMDENNSIEVTNSLEGSEIYVKVIDKNMEEMYFWDGSQLVYDFVPTLDISAGLITGQSIDVNVTIDGNSSTAVLPSGMGIPIPFLFGSVTMFNVSSVPNMLLPTPLVLNDQYTLHETIANQLAAQVENGTLTVTNDASQFKLAAETVGLDSANTIHLDGFISYQKPSGLLQEINFAITNSTSAETLISIDIDLIREEHIPLGLQIGDTFEITVDEAGFEYSLAGDANNADLVNDLNQLQGNMSSLVGETLVEFEVIDIDGLYYSVQGSVFNGTDEPRIPFPDGEQNRTDFWFVGFGRLGPGMPIPTNDPARSMDEVWVEYYNETSGNWEGDYEWITVPIRQRALPGPFVTPDYGIYSSWDVTLAFLADFTGAAGIEIMESIEDAYSTIRFYSSTTDSPILDLNHVGGVSGDGSYGWDFNMMADIGIWINNTYEESFYNETDGTYYYENVTEYNEIDFTAEAAMGMDYDAEGVLLGTGMGVNFTLEVYVYNDTQDLSWGQINITNFKISSSVLYTPYVAPATSTSDSSTTDSSDTGTATDSSTDDTSSTTSDTTSSTTDDGGEETPSVELPGFEFLTVISLFAAIGIITRFRKL